MIQSVSENSTGIKSIGIRQVKFQTQIYIKYAYTRGQFGDTWCPKGQEMQWKYDERLRKAKMDPEKVKASKEGRWIQEIEDGTEVVLQAWPESH